MAAQTTARIRWLQRLAFWRVRRREAPEIQAARALIRAIDAGGVPLNPARINQIARALGLEVSVRAPQEATIERIRAALARVTAGGSR